MTAAHSFQEDAGCAHNAAHSSPTATQSTRATAECDSEAVRGADDALHSSLTALLSSMATPRCDSEAMSDEKFNRLANRLQSFCTNVYEEQAEQFAEIIISKVASTRGETLGLTDNMRKEIDKLSDQFAMMEKRVEMIAKYAESVDDRSNNNDSEYGGYESAVLRNYSSSNMQDFCNDDSPTRSAVLRFRSAGRESENAISPSTTDVQELARRLSTVEGCLHLVTNQQGNSDTTESLALTCMSAEIQDMRNSVRELWDITRQRICGGMLATNTLKVETKADTRSRLSTTERAASLTASAGRLGGQCNQDGSNGSQVRLNSMPCQREAEVVQQPGSPQARARSADGLAIPRSGSPTRVSQPSLLRSPSPQGGSMGFLRSRSAEGPLLHRLCGKESAVSLNSLPAEHDTIVASGVAPLPTSAAPVGTAPAATVPPKFFSNNRLLPLPGGGSLRSSSGKKEGGIWDHVHSSCGSSEGGSVTWIPDGISPRCQVAASGAPQHAQLPPTSPPRPAVASWRPEVAASGAPQPAQPPTTSPARPTTPWRPEVAALGVPQHAQPPVLPTLSAPRQRSPSPVRIMWRAEAPIPMRTSSPASLLASTTTSVPSISRPEAPQPMRTTSPAPMLAPSSAFHRDMQYLLDTNRRASWPHGVTRKGGGGLAASTTKAAESSSPAKEHIIYRPLHEVEQQRAACERGGLSVSGAASSVSVAGGSNTQSSAGDTLTQSARTTRRFGGPCVAKCKESPQASCVAPSNVKYLSTGNKTNYAKSCSSFAQSRATNLQGIVSKNATTAPQAQVPSNTRGKLLL
eukprot:TRINITY_DN51726_c0_g1_i1.p1 TRINITY_DN51726_c0_g1~~TRINITY_DN51726_c0_g1_i1.p1  ORF type:complete len:803 (-),score=133.78 TRINITY_DN51726_c0_g1_i1:176-2584(-)